MDFKIVAKADVDSQSEYADTDSRSGLQSSKKAISDSSDSYTQNPKLVRKDGMYYIEFENDMVDIEEWEAIEVYNHPEKVYDIIISHRRKFYFNTAEDSVASLANGGFSLYKAEVLGDESERKETV